MDFTNLVITPFAAAISFLVVTMSVLIRPRSEGRSLLPAFTASLIVTALLVQPWHFTSSPAIGDGIVTLLIFNTLGFAIGALAGLLTVKGTRLLRDHLWPRA